jgi:hypothetical protein
MCPSKAAFGLLLIVCASAGAGCAMQRWAARDESERRAARLQEVQLEVMRYADDYGARIADPLETLNVRSTSPEARLAAHDWRITQSTAAYTIASGPNPVINALDMIVLATLSRMVVEDIFGAGAHVAPLLTAHRDLERRSWALIGDMVSSEQAGQLQALIGQWRAEYPGAQAVSQIRFADFSIMAGRRSGAAPGGGSLFALIGLDPLGNLDPAVRELEQTRQLAERTIYYLQRAPSLLDMQVERLAYQLAVAPEVKHSLAGVERIGFAAEALGKLTADAPAIIAGERHALIVELTTTLRSEQARLQELLTHVHDVLEAGTQTSESVSAAIAELDTLVVRLQARGTPAGEADRQRRPFDVTEYGQTARELAAAARELQALLVQLDASSTGIQRLTAATKQGLNEVIAGAFWRGIVLIAVLALAALLSALIYLYVVRRIGWKGSGADPSRVCSSGASER